jgi:hypothetical protein
MDDDAIRVLVKDLSRPHSSGGQVIERAAILAAGADFVSIMGWITDHAGVPDDVIASTPRRGLHGSRLHDGAGTMERTPLRYVLPAAAFS